MVKRRPNQLTHLPFKGLISGKASRDMGGEEFDRLLALRSLCCRLRMMILDELKMLFPACPKCTQIHSFPR